MVKNLAVNGLSLALVLAVAGCWDEGTMEDCVGVSCPSGFQWPHGGELRAWYIKLPNGGEVRRLYGIFIEDEGKAEGVSETSLYTRPLPEIGRCAHDLTAVVGTNPTYMDVGESITFHLGGEDVTIPKQEAMDGMPVIDFYGRQHQIAYLLETFVPPTPEFHNSFHTIETAEPQEFSDKLVDQMYMPPALNVISPPSPATFKRGEDVVFKFEQVEQEDPSVPVAAAIVFAPTTDPRSTPTLCVSANTGEFVVPAEVIDNLESDIGIVLVGTATNQAIVRADGHMINMWAQNCKAIPWTRTE